MKEGMEGNGRRNGRKGRREGRALKSGAHNESRAGSARVAYVPGVACVRIVQAARGVGGPGQGAHKGGKENGKDGEEGGEREEGRGREEGRRR